MVTGDDGTMTQRLLCTNTAGPSSVTPLSNPPFARSRTLHLCDSTTAGLAVRGDMTALHNHSHADTPLLATSLLNQPDLPLRGSDGQGGKSQSETKTHQETAEADGTFPHKDRGINPLGRVTCYRTGVAPKSVVLQSVAFCFRKILRWSRGAALHS